jgi:tRNA modification GTPase
LDQCHGALDRDFAGVIDLLNHNQIEEAQERLAQVTRFNLLGRHLIHPWRVVVAGPPNVGKSSLINRLVGYPRCVVAPVAGTTRDLVTASIAVEGWPVELIDTAGERESDDPLEQSGVVLARNAARTADLVLWLTDASTSDRASPGEMENVIWVRNKIDLSPAAVAIDSALPISALTGQGLDGLLSRIAELLVPEVPPAGAPVPFSPAISDQLARVANLLATGVVQDAVAELDRVVHGADSGNPP